MKIVIYIRHIQAIQKNNIKAFFQCIQTYKLHAIIYKTNQDIIRELTAMGITMPTFSKNEELDKNIELMISLGGDGTFLDAVELIREKNIPIIGINFGRLGFLANASQDNINGILKAIIDHNYLIEKRMLLKINYVVEANAIFDNSPQSFALNDCVIKAVGERSMLKINAFLNGEFLTSYWSDGVIVSSPTGSTGYALSCNGPIIFPETPCLLITPIAAHTLNIRPIIVPAQAVISFEIHSRDSHFTCTLDARHYQLSNNVQIAVRQHSEPIHMVKLRQNTFLDTLKKKLLWGEDTRLH